MRKPGYLWTGALLAAVLAVSFCVPSIGSARQGSDEHHYYVLIGGTGDPDSSNFPPVHDGKAVPVEYPACAPACGATSYDQSVAAGHAHARKAIERIYADDRAARFTVAGYSQGAHVANLVLNDIADGKVDIPAERFDAKLYADPMQPGTGAGANVPKGVGAPPPLAMTSPGPGRSDFGGILQYHVVGQRYDRDGLAQAGQVSPLPGGELKVANTGSGMTVTDAAGNTANVLCGNIPTANATVFVIDKVLMPAKS